MSETSADKIMPHNIEAEQSVLGALMLNNEAIITVADMLLPDDFYRPAHQRVYDACLQLFETNEPIDLLSLSNKLEERGALEDSGGSAYLTDLVNAVPSASNVKHYARIVKKKKTLRDLITASQKIAQLGFEEDDEDIEQTLDEAEQAIFSISQQSLRESFTPVRSALEEAFERIDLLHKQEGGLRGVPTGFYELDNILSGLQRSDMVVLAARPSLGKTTLALDMARHAAVDHDIPVGIFSLEMSREQVVDRFICAQATVDLWRLRTGRLSSEGENNDFYKIQDAMGILSEAPIFIDDTPSPNIMQLRTMARRLQAEHELGLLVVDYLQLIQPRTSSDSMVQQVTEISRSLKALARELDVPVLALSQLSRAVEQRSPQIPRMADLRESGAIEQDADVVMFIYREDRDKKDTNRKNIADIIVAKHRNGPTGKIELYFQENSVSFKNLERRRSDTEQAAAT